MTTSAAVRTGRHCVFSIHVHLVFVTKYRKKVFAQAVLTRATEIFADVCQRFEADLIECEGEHDHVHLLVHYPPKVAISKLVNSLKGVLWAPRYFASSCGGAPVAIVRRYIQSQDTPR